MKNLVLSALVAGIALQAAACTVNDDNRIAVTWNYKINEQISNTCPSGVTTVNLVISSLTGGGTNVYAYTCQDIVLEEYVPDDDYQIWVELVTGNGQVYAKSLSLVDSVFGVDKDITFDIHEDRGFFYVQWDLRGEITNAPLLCSDIPGLDTVSILATPVGTGAMVESDMVCAPGEGASRALPPVGYTVDIDAINKNTGDSFGSIDVLTNRVINPRNSVTDLGIVLIPIDGE